VRTLTVKPYDPGNPHLPIQKHCETCWVNPAISREFYDGWGYTSLCEKHAKEARNREYERKIGEEYE